MDKKVMYVVGGLIVIALIAFFAMKKGPTGENTGGMYGNPESQNTAQAQSMKELLASGSPQKCTFTNKTEGADSSGVVYVANGKMRGDFTSVASGQTIESHMIVDSDVAYVWSSAMAQGIKMSFAAASGGNAGANSPQQNQAVDVNARLNYDCGAWGADQSLFVLPSGVTFSDMSAMMGAGAGAAVGAGAGPSGGDYKAAQCAACDQAGDATSKAQCRAAMGC